MSQIVSETSGTAIMAVPRNTKEEGVRMGDTLAAHEAQDAMAFKEMKHHFRELKTELEETMGNCNNSDWEGLAALSLIWDRNRGGYGDCGGNGLAGIRDLQLAQQINDGNRGVTNDITAMSTQLHDQGNFNNLNTTILTTQNALSSLISAGQLQTSEQSLYLRGEIGNLRAGQDDISRDILKSNTDMADRFHAVDINGSERTFALSREIDAVDRHQIERSNGIERLIEATTRATGDRLCGIEKTQIMDKADLSRQMQECCCELKMEGMQNTQRLLDEMRCYREKDMEKEILTLRGELSQNRQTADIIKYLVAAGVVPAAAA